MKQLLGLNLILIATDTTDMKTENINYPRSDKFTCCYWSCKLQQVICERVVQMAYFMVMFQTNDEWSE